MFSDYKSSVQISLSIKENEKNEKAGDIAQQKRNNNITKEHFKLSILRSYNT